MTADISDYIAGQEADYFRGTLAIQHDPTGAWPLVGGAGA